MNIIENSKIILNYSIIIWIILIVILLSSISSHFVNALGVAPSRDIIQFQEGIQTRTASIINNNHENMKVVLYAQGELAEFTKIKDNTIKINENEEEKTFEYTLDLPGNLSPGPKELKIIIMELPEKFVNEGDNVVIVGSADKPIVYNSEKETIVGATTAVTHTLRVDVPYPGVFAEGNLYVTEGKVNDTLTFTANVFNRGKESIETYSDIIIKGPTNEEIANMKTDKSTINSQDNAKLSVGWIANVNPGLYYVEANVHYAGQVFVLRKTFYVGNLFIELKDIKVDNFRLGEIAKFDITLQSKWNQEINEVYADMETMKDGKTITSFKTSTVDISPLGEQTIYGYWDTKGMTIGDYDINVILHYSGKTSEKLFQTVVSPDQIQVKGVSALSGEIIGSKTEGTKTSLLIILVIILIIVNVGIFFYFKKRIKKTE